MFIDFALPIILMVNLLKGLGEQKGIPLILTFLYLLECIVLSGRLMVSNCGECSEERRMGLQEHVERECDLRRTKLNKNLKDRSGPCRTGGGDAVL